MVPRDWWWNERRITKSEGTRSSLSGCAHLAQWPLARPSALSLAFASRPSLGTDSLERPGVAQKMWYCIILTCCAHIICIEIILVRQGRDKGTPTVDSRAPPGLPAVFIFPIEHWTLTLSLKPINKSQYTLKIKLWNDGRRSLVGYNIFNGR